MAGIRRFCIHYGDQGAQGDDRDIAYAKAAIIAGFKTVAEAMLAFGVV
jgi:hypothetical protein